MLLHTAQGSQRAQLELPMGRCTGRGFPWTRMDGGHLYYNCSVDSPVDPFSIKGGSSPRFDNGASDGTTGWAGQRLLNDVANASDLLQIQQKKLDQGTSYNIFADGRGCVDGQRGRWRGGQGRREASGRRSYRQERPTLQKHLPIPFPPHLQFSVLSPVICVLDRW